MIFDAQSTSVGSFFQLCIPMKEVSRSSEVLRKFCWELAWSRARANLGRSVRYDSRG